MSDYPSYHPHPGVKDQLNAFLAHPSTSSVKHAPQGPLHGLTFAVKDIYDVVGYKTGCGNPDHYAEGNVMTENAYGVQALLNAGAEFVGKVQTDEFAWCISGLSTHLPAPINYLARDRTTGGSSSGSAAALLGGLCDLAVASDTQGSVRTPASYCGLIGLRTTHGRIPMTGSFPACPSMDTFGWFAKDLGTYTKVAEVLLKSSQTATADISHVKLVTYAQFVDVLMSDAEKVEYMRMQGVMEGVFGKIEPACTLKFTLEQLVDCITTIRSYEQWQHHGAWFTAKERRMTPQVRERYEKARTVTKQAYEDASRLRSHFREQFTKEVLGEHNILVLPTTPSVAPLRTAHPTEMQNYRQKAVQLLNFASLAGVPQITLPIGEVNDLPFGISMIGRAGDDELLIRMAELVLHKDHHMCVCG